MKLFGVENTSRDDHSPVTHELIREKKSGFPFVAFFSILLIFITLVWLFVSWRISEWCIYYGNYSCWQGAIVFWSLPVVLLIFVIVAATITLRGMYYTARKARLANALTEHYDEREVSKYTPQLIGVAGKIADSLATAELDTLSTTYSPRSVTETSTTSVNSEKEERTDDLDVLESETTIESLIRHGRVGRSGNSFYIGEETDV